MRVRVDPNVCACTGYCVKIAPEVFALPEAADHSQVQVDTVEGAELQERVREAENTCPTQAINVEE